MHHESVNRLTRLLSHKIYAISSANLPDLPRLPQIPNPVALGNLGSYQIFSRSAPIAY